MNTDYRKFDSGPITTCGVPHLALLRVSMVVFISVAVLSAVGCRSSILRAPILQQTAPVVAPSIVGPLACPRCGLLCEQGCLCRPDVWNAGYHPTCWSHINVTPCCSSCPLPVEVPMQPMMEAIPLPHGPAPAPPNGPHPPAVQPIPPQPTPPGDNLPNPGAVDEGAFRMPRLREAWSNAMARAPWSQPPNTPTPAANDEMQQLQPPRR